MHPFLLPVLVGSLLGSPLVPRTTAELADHGPSPQVQPAVLMLAPPATPIVQKLPTDKLQPKWTEKLGETTLTVTPRRESGGFKIDVQIDW